jgi:hypothetical protein
MSGGDNDPTDPGQGTPADSAPVQSTPVDAVTPEAASFESPASWEQIDTITKGADGPGETRDR